MAFVSSAGISSLVCMLALVISLHTKTPESSDIRDKFRGEGVLQWMQLLCYLHLMSKLRLVSTFNFQHKLFRSVMTNSRNTHVAVARAK